MLRKRTGIRNAKWPHYSDAMGNCQENARKFWRACRKNASTNRFGHATYPGLTVAGTYLRSGILGESRALGRYKQSVPLVV